MIVVSDTSPLISFLKIDRLDILEKLFGKIIVPEAVYAELVNNYEFSTEAQIIRQNNFIEPVEISSRDNVLQIQNETGLDLGESEAIFLTHNLNILWMYCAHRIDISEKTCTVGYLKKRYNFSLCLLCNACLEFFGTATNLLAKLLQFQIAAFSFHVKAFSKFRPNREAYICYR